jgi:hypothetical protein
MARPVNLEVEIERFLDALDEKAAALRDVVAATKTEVARSSFANYKKFAEVCGDFDSFCILIEYRLKRLPQGSGRAQLDARFHAARVAHMSRQLKTSIELMGIVASTHALPLGAKDVFLRELRSIYALKNALSEPAFADSVAAETAHDIELAEKILREIIERAPTMLELSLGIENGEATAVEV